MIATRASQVWQALNGIVCLYKPPAMSMITMQRYIARRLCDELNQMEHEPIGTIEREIVQSQTSVDVVNRQRQLDYSRHPLVCGQPYMVEDVRIELLQDIETSSSGVCVMAINDDGNRLKELRERRLVNSYIIDAQLGRETYNNEIDGKVIHTFPFDHVTRFGLLKLLARIQSHYRRAAFDYAGVDIQSQAAFELALSSGGRPRPAIDSPAVIYSMHLVHYTPPRFRLQLQCIGETDFILRDIVQQLGGSLLTTACTRRLRRTRIGCFGVDFALLRKHWTLQYLIANMNQCRRLMQQTTVPTDSIVPIDDDQLMHVGLMDKRLLIDYLPNDDDEEQGAIAEQRSFPIDHIRVQWGRDYD